MSIEDLRVSAATEETAADYFRSDIAEEIALSQNDGDEEIRGVEVAQATPTGDRLPAPGTTPQPAATTPADNRITPDAANIVRLAATVSIDDIRIEGADLVLVQADGTEIVIVNGATRVPTIMLGDVELPQQTFIAALEGNGINVAAGPDGSYSASSAPGSSGGNFEDSINASQNGPIALADLLGDTSFDDGTPAGVQETGKDVPVAFATAFGSVLSEAADANGVFEQSTFNGQLTFISGSQQGRVTSVALNTEQTVALTSGGVAVVTEMTTGGDAANPTVILTGRAGGETVFVLEITNTLTGEFTFTLLKALDHGAAGATGAADLLGLQFNYTVTDNDGDPSSSTFSIQIADDGPSTVAVAQSSVHDEALAGGNADISAATATLSNVQLNIDWGADSANNTSANDRSLVFTNANVTVAGAFGAALTSFGVAVSTIVLADGTLVGYTGAAPSSINGENVVFHASLSDAGNGSYSFTLVKSLDHQAGGGQSPLTLTFGYTATDSDGDSAANTFVVSIVDDAPVANAGTASTAEEESLGGGNNDTTDGLLATAGGSLNIDWGSDNANLGGANDRSVAFTNATVTVAGAYGSALTSFGVAVSTIVLANGTLVGYTGAAPSSISAENVVFHASLSDAARGAYAFTLVKPLDHAAGDGTTGEASLSLTFNYTATDSDGDSASSQFTIRVADDTLEFFDPEENVSISEDALPENVDDNGSENPETGTPDDGGPTPLRLLAVSSENPITGGSLGIRWGADDANGQGNAGLTQGGANDRGVGFTDDDIAGLYEQELTSDGIALFYVPSENGTVLTAHKGSETGEVVFTVRLSDESEHGSYTFELQGNLDHTLSLGDASFGIRFDFTARDSDGDVGNSSFVVTIVDDNPVIGAPEATRLDEENVTGLNGNPGDTYTGSKGSEGSGSVTGSLGVSWGADSNNTGSAQRSLSFNGYDAVTGGEEEAIVYRSVMNGGLSLTASGKDVYYFSKMVGDVPMLVGFTGSNPSIEENWVFTVTLDDNAKTGEYTFTLLQAIDHRGAGAEDDLSLSFDFRATDSDGDFDDGTFTVTINDDAPVAGTAEVGTVEDEAVNGGNKETESPVNLSAEATGKLNISWGSDAAADQIKVVFNENKEMTVEGAASTQLSSLGLKVETAVIGGVLVGYTGEVKPETTSDGNVVFRVSLSTDGSGAYRFELVKPLDHAAGNGATGETPLSLTFDYTATDADGDAIDGTFTVKVADDVATIGTPFAGGIVEEEQKEVAGDGNEDIGSGAGDLDADGRGGFLGLQFRDRTTHVAGGTLAISWGADKANGEANNASGQPGDRSVQFTADGLVDLKNQALTSDGKEISYTVITVNGQPTLVAYTGSEKPTTLPANANDAISAHIVFSVALSDIEAGSYKFTLFDTLDHQGSLQGEDALALTFEFTATDSDGDVTGAKSFAVQVIDDTPIAFGTILDRYVEEEALADGNPDSSPAGAETAGYLANGLQPVTDKTGGPLNIAWGADDGNAEGIVGYNGTQVAGDRSVVFATVNRVAGSFNVSDFLTVRSGNTTLDVSKLTSSGKLLVFTLSDNGTVLTARAGEGGDVVFTVKLSDTGSGSYSFDLDGVLDHPNKASGAANEDVLSFTFKFDARDGDGDIATNDFTVKVIDDSPIAQTGTASTVEDEAVNRGGNNESEPDLDLSNEVKDVALNIKWGADSADDETITSGPGNRSVAFTGEAIKVSGAASTTGLTSHGLTVNTTLVDGVLIGHTGTSPSEPGAITVFRVTLSDDGVGSYSFKLLQPLDHAAGNGENTLTLTFGYKATDSDGDTATNTFTVSVIDDVPIAGNAGDRYVEEEALRYGNEDWSPIGVELAGLIANGGPITAKTSASLEIKWGSDDGNSRGSVGYTGTQVAGDRSIVFEIGASNPVPSGVAPVAPDFSQILTVKSGETTIALADLKSGGQSLTYALTDNGTKLTATAGGKTIFEVTLSDLGRGSYAFELKGAIDHPVKAVGASNEDVLTFNFTYTARDGDGDKATGNFAVNVIDDSPVQTWWPTTNLTLNEDDLRPIGDNTQPYGNDTRPEGLSASGNLNVSFGADGGTFELKSGKGNWDAATNTLTAKDGSWQITVAADGRYTFTLLKNTLSHGPGDNGENTVSIDVDFTATDGDGDSVSGDFNIRIVDDVPVATRAAIHDFVYEAALSDNNPATWPASAGSLSTLVSFGADGVGKYTVEMEDLSASLQSLTSNGVTITYSLDGNMLVAKAGGVPIFTFEVNQTTGDYTFTQQGPIDHSNILVIDGKEIAAAALDDRAERVNDKAIGHSGLAYVGRTDEGDVIMRVTNKSGSQVSWTLDDNDPSTTNDLTLTIPKGTTVYINIGPVANGTVFDLNGNNSPSGTATVSDKSIPVLNDTSLTLDLSTAVTVSDADGDTLALSGKLNVKITDTAPTMAPVNAAVFEDGVKTMTESLGIDWKSDAGSLKTLAIGGLVDVKTQSGTPLDKITSNSNTVTVVMIGSVLVGYIGSTKPVDASAASVVFTVSVDMASGAYTFDLRQPLDHVSPSGGEQYLALTFQAIATDADGDVAKADFTVKVDAAGVLGSIDYSALDTGVFVNLSAGATTVNGQTVAADTATDMKAVTNKVVGIDGMAGVNDAKGGSGNDILIGGAENNRLTGNAGNDILDGGLGADILDGGEGDDRFILRADVTGSGKRMIEINGVLVEVSIDGLAGTSDKVTGGLGNDVIELQRGDKAGYVADYRSAPNYISGVEKIIGTDGNDVIILAADTVADGGRITIEGGDGHDVIGGSNAGDTIYGGDGNDLISGLGGDDILEGGDGDDTIWGGDGNDTIRGGKGADTLYGEDGADKIGGKEGNDVISGGKGNDEIWGDAGDDRIIWNVGDGHDKVHGNNVDIGATGTDTFIANGNDEDQSFSIETKAAYQTRTNGMLFDSGSEIVVSRDGDVASELRAIDQIEVNGGTGKDTIVVKGDFNGSDFDTRAITIKTGAGDDVIDASGIISRHGIIAEAGAGDDVLRGGAGNDILDGGEGIDTVDYSRDGQGVYVQLGAGWATTRANAQAHSSDYAGLQAKVAADTIENDKLRNIENVTGTDFADIINGDGGNNVIKGGGGGDWIEGGAGNDTLYGDAGNDTLIGGTGNDALYGGEGNDTLAGGTGKNKIDGGDGIDTVDYSLGGFSANGKGVYVQLGSGWATSRADSDGVAYGALRDAVVANTIDNDRLSNIENVTGTDFADIINGDGGNNVIKGGAGGDWIEGGAGNDTLYGEDGNDTLVGGTGDDILDGGDGNDTLKGGRGNDTLKGGTNAAVTFANTAASNAAAAIIASAGGGDTADYSDVTTGVVANISNGNPGWPASIAAGTATDRDANNAAVGTDTLSGIENLTGGSGNDVLVGNDEANILIGGAGSDTLIGGAGNDLLIGGDDNVADGLFAGAGDDVLILGNGGGTAKGEGGNDLIFGGDGNDYLYGEDDGNPNAADAGNDVIFGGGGNDYIEGNGGNDTLYGEDGNDTIVGGKGDDVMSGGAGNDTFIHTVGDGNDIVDGGGETGTTNPNYDVLTINGVASKTTFTLGKMTGGSAIQPASDKTDIQVSYTGGSVRADEIERVVFNLGAAGDTVSVGDLTGTAIAPTTVVINGGEGDDVIDLTGLLGTTVEITDRDETAAGDVDTVILAGRWVDYTINRTDDGVFTFTKGNAVIATAKNIEHFTFMGENNGAGGTMRADQLLSDAPVGVADDNADDAVVEAGQGVIGDASAIGNVLVNDTDADPVPFDIKTVSAIRGAAGVTVSVPSGGTTITGMFGTLTIKADGNYVYALDNNDADTQTLAKGETGLDVFTYTVKDIHGLTSTANLSITIAGSNDAPVVGEIGDYEINEDTPWTVSAEVIANFVNGYVSDVDTPKSALTFKVFVGEKLVADFTAATIPAGGISYQPDLNVNGKLDARLEVSDGIDTVTQPFHINVAPVNDRPVVTAVSNGSVTEDATRTFSTGELVVNGGFETGNFSGWNWAGQNFTSLTATALQVHSGIYALKTGPINGMATMSQAIQTIAGQSYSLSFWMKLVDHDNAFTLKVGDTELARFDDAAPFGYTQYQYTFTATAASTVVQFGFYNLPDYFYVDDISAKGTGTIVAQSQAVNGSISFTDVETTDIHTASSVALATGYVGTFTIGPVVEANGSGSIAWNFAVGNNDIQFLRGGQSIDQTYVVTIDDGHGGVTTQNVVVTINGTNDAPTAIVLNGNAINENLTGGIIGNLTTTDVDLGDTHSYSVNDGRFEVTNGQLKLKDGIALDYEAGPSVGIVVTSTDGGNRSISQTFTINVGDLDEIRPTVSSIVMADKALKIGDTSVVTITFSEKVTGFANDDVTFENGSLGTLSSADGGKTWTALFTPSADIEDTSNVIRVAPTYADLAGNAGYAAQSVNYTVDTKAPTVVSIEMNDASLQAGETSSVRITFSEKVDNFDRTDVTVQGGQLSALTASTDGKVWTGTFTPGTNIESTANVISVANTYTDVAGNAGTAGIGSNYTVDTKAPVVTSIVMSDSSLTVGETSKVTITFSEKVENFDKNDVTVENGTLSALTSSLDGKTWTGTFTPKADINDTTNVIKVANTYNDVAGNTGAAATSGNYTIDTRPPNEAPASNPDVIFVSDASDVVIPWAMLLGNDSDPEGSVLTITEVSKLSGVAGGNIAVSIDVVAKTVTFTTPDLSGWDYADDVSGNQFTYKVQDAQGNFSTETVTVKVIDTNIFGRTFSVSGSYNGSYLEGHGGGDTLNGGSAVDHLYGESGNDILRGNGGNDVLSGGTGNDTLYGGSGADLFKWTEGTRIFGNADVIKDYSYTEGDKIDLQTLVGGVVSTPAKAVDNIRLRTDGNDLLVQYRAGDFGSWSTIYTLEDAKIGQSSSVRLHFGSNDWTFTIDNKTGTQTVVMASDPIILDLDHNGFAFSSLDNGVSFDINADGHKDQVAWTSADGILAYDLDGNGRIDNGSEIFTPSFNGGGHASGIAALATLDSNGDGRIDAEDDAFSKLSIWVDANHNGVSDDGELSGLLDHRVTSISLDTTASEATEDGQAVLSQGHFTLADGSSGDFLEVGFDTMFGGQPDHVVIGGDTDDVLVGGPGFTQFTGGAGADTFVLDPAALQTLDMADVVTDYKAGEGDVLDVSKLLDSMLGDTPVTAEAAAASIRTTVTGNDTTVSVQVDDGWKDVAVLQNHTEAVKILFDDKHTIDVNHH